MHQVDHIAFVVVLFTPLLVVVDFARHDVGAVHDHGLTIGHLVLNQIVLHSVGLIRDVPRNHLVQYVSLLVIVYGKIRQKQTNLIPADRIWHQMVPRDE